MSNLPPEIGLQVNEMSLQPEDWLESPICRTVPGLAIEPSPIPQQALIQLLDHIRSVVIALLSYELQTPASTIQIAIESLSEGHAIPAQAQRHMTDVAIEDLVRICDPVDGCLVYAAKVWSITLDFVQSHSNQQSTTYLNTIFTTLPDVLEKYQPWMNTAKARLISFLQRMSEENPNSDRLVPLQQVALLEKRREEVLAVVNHELRTPFTTLQVCLETLHHDMDMDEKDRQSLLEIAAVDLNRLCELVSDLELLCRLEAGQVCFATERVDLNATIQAAISSFLKQSSLQRRCDVCIESVGHLSSIWTDGYRLVDIVRRLLDNACRFTQPQGDINLSIQVISPETEPDGTIEAQAGDQSALVLCIADEGVGVCPEELERIFDCFHQEEGYLKREVGGIGIGLTICRYLTEGLGGQIWADSPGKDRGSRFCIKLPVYPPN
ncbi:MAG: ATP-binding protein [Cyanobacteria bacterium P01_F01_bin.150]